MNVTFQQAVSQKQYNLKKMTGDFDGRYYPPSEPKVVQKKVEKKLVLESLGFNISFSKRLK